MLFNNIFKKSLDADNGRSISLWPHGVLFRDSEAEMRKKMVEEDLVECVIGLGPNLFYNSPMEACLLITRTKKDSKKKDKILFINAVNEVKQEKTMGYLLEDHINKIFDAYSSFETIENFASLVPKDDVLGNKGNMAINLYVRPENKNNEIETSFEDAFEVWTEKSKKMTQSMNELFNLIEN